MTNRDQKMLEAMIQVDRHMQSAETRLEFDLFAAGSDFEEIAAVVEIGREMYAEQRPQLRAQMLRTFDNLVSDDAEGGSTADGKGK